MVAAEHSAQRNAERDPKQDQSRQRRVLQNSQGAGGGGHDVAAGEGIDVDAAVSKHQQVEGANPVLAPGILMLGAVIALMAIYKHPLLETK